MRYNVGELDVARSIESCGSTVRYGEYWPCMQRIPPVDAHNGGDLPSQVTITQIVRCSLVLGQRPTSGPSLQCLVGMAGLVGNWYSREAHFV